MPLFLLSVKTIIILVIRKVIKTMNLKGTKTEKNLQAAFAGESMANTKYTFYSMKAREEGYEQIADFFKETARNEQEHAFLWFKFLHDGLPTTTENLKDALS